VSKNYPKFNKIWDIDFLANGVEKGWNPHTIIFDLVLRWINSTLNFLEKFREPESNPSSCYSSIDE
jgi:hypothetical protein